MIDKLRVGAATLPLICWIALACTTVFGISGCASSVSSASGGAQHADIVTESDEPDGRRRARIRLELAVGYFDKGQTKVALDEVKQALMADPGWFEAYNLRGLIYMRLGDVPLAEESFRRALAINPRAATVQHNYGWLLCQNSRMPEALQLFRSALANPAYGERAKTWMSQGLCQMDNGMKQEAELSLQRSYELDAANPMTAYNLSLLLFQRADFVRAQFYVRRLNNSAFANAESLWLGIKVERRMQNQEAMAQLVSQLKKRYPQSREYLALERGAFDE